jgi:general secretion pathway protein G
MIDPPTRWRQRRPAWSKGFSLMEIVIVLFIVSALAAIAAPYARKSFQREKELELRETLRTVRTAIDKFHADWEKSLDNKQAPKAAASPVAAEPPAPKFPASGNGYPLSLQILVDGVDKPKGKGERIRYLRSLPVNPFAPRAAPLDKQWSFVSSGSGGGQIATSSYGETLAEAQRKEKDIYDLHAMTPEVALDGTRYADW